MSINLLVEATAPLAELINELKSTMDRGQFHIAEGISSAFEMYADAMSGANYANQADLAGTAAPSLFDLCDRVLQKLTLVDTLKDNKVWKPRRLSMRSVAPFDVYLPSSHVQKRNIVASRVKQSITRCLLAFLEGASRTHQQVTHQLLVTLQWTGIMNQLDMAYKALNQEELIPSTEVMMEGLGYYKLLLTTEVYDEPSTHILPLLSRSSSEPTVRFFAQRIGCVEVLYNGRVERVLFALPESCLPGGPMNETHHLNDIMHATEWINRDKKVCI